MMNIQTARSDEEMAHYIEYMTLIGDALEHLTFYTRPLTVGRVHIPSGVFKGENPRADSAQVGVWMGERYYLAHGRCPTHETIDCARRYLKAYATKHGINSRWGRDENDE